MKTAEKTYTMAIVRKEHAGKTYKVTPAGTYYHVDTPDEVITVLERCREAGRRIVIRLGYQTQADADAAGLGGKEGQDWLEESDCEGTIGRSMGPVKVPLMISAKDRGGPQLLDHCIVRISSRGLCLYEHPHYNRPALTIGLPREEDRAEGYTEAVYRNGQRHAQFRKAGAAAKWIEKMSR